MTEYFKKENRSDKINQLNKMVADSRKIVFFGGAGVSTESGIPDFRSADGLYSERLTERRISPEEMLSRSFFDSHTEEFYAFYREKMLFLDAEPNRAHLKLAELERAGKDITVVTQNIDGLHQKAGSKKVLELHGSVLRNRCMKCGKAYSVDFVADKSRPVPLCSDCGGIVKPDVVLYEESLDEQVIMQTVKAISECDMLIVAGTSLAVYPAAGFLRYFNGAYSVLINLTKTENERSSDIIFHEKVGDVLSEIDTSLCIK